MKPRIRGGIEVFVGVMLTIGLTTGAGAAFANTTGADVYANTPSLQNAVNAGWQYKTTSNRAASLYIQRIGGNAYKVNARVQKTEYQSAWSTALSPNSLTNLPNSVSSGSYTWVGIRLSTYVLTTVLVSGWFTAN